MFLFIWLQLPSTFSIWWRFWPHLQFFLVERSSLLDDASNTQWRSLTSNFKLYIGVEQKCVKAAKSDDSQRHFYLAPVKANTGRKASSKDIIHFDSSPPQRDKKPNMAVCLNLQKRNRCQSWCQHKNRKRSQAPNAPPTAGNAANHRESRAALCLILRCWHLEGNFTSRRCHMVIARRRLAHNFFLPLAKEQIPQSAGYQQLLTILNDHHVLNYLRASPHTAWVGADVGRLQFKWTVVWE